MTTRTISITRADGTQISATVTLGVIETDGDYPRWRNATVAVAGRVFGVGGAVELRAQDAARANACAGLQPETHPEMHWPGAVHAGDWERYDLRSRLDGGRVGPRNYDECGEVEALMAHLGYAPVAGGEPVAAAWDEIAEAIDGAVAEMLELAA